MGGESGTFEGDEKPYISPVSRINLEFVEFNLHNNLYNNFEEPVLPYDKLMECKKRETKFLPAEDPPKKIGLGKVGPGTLRNIKRMAGLKYNDGDGKEGIGGQVL
jgi:hypothetical protein